MPPTPRRPAARAAAPPEAAREPWEDFEPPAAADEDGPPFPAEFDPELDGDMWLILPETPRRDDEQGE